MSFKERLEALSSTLTLSEDSCVSARSTQGPELLYKATVPINHKVEVSVSTSPHAPVSVYLFTDCEDAAKTCLEGVEDSPESQPTTLRYINTTVIDQTLFIAIDTPRLEADQGGDIEGAIQIKAIECFPGDQRCSEDNASSVERCTPAASYERYACDGECFDGQCLKRSGDSCGDAFELPEREGYIEGDWAGGEDLFNPATGLIGQCYINEGVTHKGREDFYRITLNAGDLLEATVTTSAKTASLFILEDCADLKTCVVNNPVQGTATLRYYATQARTMYLVVDNSSLDAEERYTLSWSARPGGVCAPGLSRCLDANTAGLCDPSATLELPISCARGCIWGGCKLTTPEHNSCAAVAASAQDVGLGISVVVDVEDFVDDISDPLACAEGYRPLGKDLFYKVRLDPQDIVEVKAAGSGNNDPFLYAFTDCALASETCVASALEVDDSDAASLRYQNQTDASQTLIIAIDANKGSATGLLQAQVAKLQPQCEPGTLKCDDNGVTLLSCDAQRQYLRYECEGGCAQGRCGQPLGDVCIDAIELVGTSGLMRGDWREGTNAFDLRQGYTGLCYTHTDAFSPSSKEDFYRIELEQGDLLSLELLTLYSNATLFILESCVDPQACVQSSRLYSPASHQYYATQARTLYIVAERRSELPGERYELRWQIHKGSRCAPNQTRCVDATTAARCSADGSVETPIPCAQGCHITGCAPDVATQDSCDAVAASAQVVTSSLSTYAHLKDFKHDRAAGATVTCPIERATQGADLFYKIELAADELLRVRADADGIVTPALFVFTDCANAAGTCVAGDGRRGQKTAFIEHANQSGTTQTVLLGVAAMGVFETGPIQIEIDISVPSCRFGSLQCSANGTSLQRCNSRGYFDTVLCDGGCSNNACLRPKGDRCFDAVPLNPGGTVAPKQYTDLVLNTTSLTPTFSLGSGRCLGATRSEGPEKFYSVILAPGQRLDATMNADAPNIALYVLTRCDDPLSCVAPSPPLLGGFRQRAQVTYTNMTDTTQTVLLVADFASPQSSGSYELVVDIEQEAEQ